MKQVKSVNNRLIDENPKEKSGNHSDKRVYMLILSLISSVLVGNEILLTRYFSTVINVNLVYLVISTALFGTGIGAYLAHKSLNDKKEVFISNFIDRNIIFLALSVSLFWIFALVGPYMKGLTIHIIGSSAAFTFGGMVMAAIYLKHSENGHELYFADLLGAVIGCALIVVAMIYFQFYSGLAIVFITTAISVLMNKNTSFKKINYTVAITVAILGISLLSDTVIDSMSRNFDAYYKNPDKGIEYISKTQDTDIDIIYSNWGAFSRTDVLELSKNQNIRYILTDGGASAPIIKYDGDLSKLEYMKSDVIYIPYLIGNNEKTLLIGSGGGKDVIYALLGGSEDITAVEINEGTINAVNESKDFSGDIYNQKGVKLVVGDGRKFVDETNETFDNIYLSMLMSNAIDNSRLSLVENYIFTEEAFKSYKNALRPDGRISFMVHNGVESVRVANTWIKTLIESGVPEKDVNKYFAIINGMKNNVNQHNSLHMPSVILKKSPFTDEELNIINNFLIEENIMPVHLPTMPNEIYQGLDNGSMSFEEVINQLDINVSPVKDSSPFFYKFTKGLPTELLPLILLIASMGAFFTFVLNKNKVSMNHSLYFTIIGMGYIIIELGFIQYLQRYLEKPIFSFTFVLAGMLAGSALGALVSGKFEVVKRLRKYSGLLVGGSTVAGYYWLSIIIAQTMSQSIPEKLAIVLPIILIIGFFMGIPFPYMIEKMSASRHTKKHIPLMYAINGYASIVGSIISIVVAMNIGFVFVIILGSVLYSTLAMFSLSTV